MIFIKMCNKIHVSTKHCLSAVEGGTIRGTLQYYVRITAEVSQILVSCETPIYLEQFCLGLHAASSTLYIQNNLRTSQLAGFACQLGYKSHNPHSLKMIKLSQLMNPCLIISKQVKVAVQSIAAILKTL